MKSSYAFFWSVSWWDFFSQIVSFNWSPQKHDIHQCPGGISYRILFKTPSDPRKQVPQLCLQEPQKYITFSEDKKKDLGFHVVLSHLEAISHKKKRKKRSSHILGNIAVLLILCLFIPGFLLRTSTSQHCLIPGATKVYHKLQIQH